MNMWRRANRRRRLWRRLLTRRRGIHPHPNCLRLLQNATAATGRAGVETASAPLYAQPQNKSLATASMILGIFSVTVGWLCMGPLFAIAAIVLGAVALSQIKKTPERVGGKQMAWTGVVTGSLALLGIIIFYVFVIIIGNL